MLTLNPSHDADLALALRKLGIARHRVDQEERVHGKARVAKVHTRALRDAMAQVSYLGSLLSIERT
jgi:hypothetical protein